MKITCLWWLWIYVSNPDSSGESQTNIYLKLSPQHFTQLLMGISHSTPPTMNSWLVPLNLLFVRSSPSQKMAAPFHQVLRPKILESPSTPLFLLYPTYNPSAKLITFTFGAILILTTFHYIYCHHPALRDHLSTWIIAIASKLFILLLPLFCLYLLTTPIYSQHRNTF